MTEASIPLQFDGDCIYKQLVAAANSSRCHLRAELEGGVDTGAGGAARGQHAGVRHPGPGHGHGWGPWPAVPLLVTGPSWPPGYKG